MTKGTITIDASQLEHWADRPDARTQLSQLVRQAVLETVHEVHLIRMPSGSSVNRPGWDGYLEVERGDPWVPDGISLWEFSCRKDIRNKATKDYDNRTSDPIGADPGSSTFVSVTARRWSEKDKGEWIEERRQEGIWQNIRVLDAEDLAMWLEQATDSSETLLRLMYPSVFQVVENRQEQVLPSTVEAGNVLQGVDVTFKEGVFTSGPNIPSSSKSPPDPDSGKVRFNTCLSGGVPNRNDNRSSDPFFAYATAVHEAGHALGLSNFSYYDLLTEGFWDALLGTLESLKSLRLINLLPFLSELLTAIEGLLEVIGLGRDQSYQPWEVAHPTIPDAVMNYDHEVHKYHPHENASFSEPDCSPSPFDLMAIYSLYQAVQ